MVDQNLSLMALLFEIFIIDIFQYSGICGIVSGFGGWHLWAFPICRLKAEFGPL
jgi:hypothetical protein